MRFLFLLVLCVSIIVIPITIALKNSIRNEDHFEITVTGRDSISNKCITEYTVVTDKGAFQFIDNGLAGKFSSSYVYGNLLVGNTYTIKVVNGVNINYIYFISK